MGLSLKDSPIDFDPSATFYDGSDETPYSDSDF